MWEVRLHKSDVLNSYTTTLRATHALGLKRIIVSEELFQKKGLLEKPAEQLKADQAEWGDNNKDERAFYLHFEGECRWTADGTPVYIGYQ